MRTDINSVNVWATAALAAVVLIVLSVGSLLYFSKAWGDARLVEVVIEEGESVRSIGSKLKSADLLISEILFTGYVELRGFEKGLRAGRYKFSRSMNIPTIVSLIAGGKSEPDDLRITVPEGLNVWEIDKSLTEIGLIREGDFSSVYLGEEGYLFPDTYRLRNSQFSISNFQLNADDSDSGREKFLTELRQKMLENFRQKTNKPFENLNPEKRKEIITIASMLEKEAKTEEDMKLVAGIIYKRLELKMPLQIDATVIYGSCLSKSQASSFKNCDVTFQGPAEEIKIDGPYNTYLRNGLPPGPISNPGLKAITAALNPASSDYLYYLSTRDGSRMIYSKTAGEHAANRRKHLGI